MRLRAATMASGVFAGATMPYQFSIKRSGMPTSAVVGTSGAVGTRWRAPSAIGHVNDVDLRRQLEQFAGEMRQAANAGGGKIEFAGLCFRKRDEFSHAFGGNVAR